MVPTVPPARIVAALLALLVPAASGAAPVEATSNAGGKATVLKSLSVLNNTELDFGTLAVTTAGTAVIDPLSGALTTTGGVSKLGSAAHAATFTATGSKNSVVLIRLPRNPITLTRVGGTETMTVSNWTLDGKTNRKIPPNSSFAFAFAPSCQLAMPCA